jgi:hypothetical protein
MAVTARDQLNATKAVLLAWRSQIDGQLIDIEAALTAVPTAPEMQDLLAQMMDAAPAVIAAVTPAKAVETI